MGMPQPQQPQGQPQGGPQQGQQFPMLQAMTQTGHFPQLMQMLEAMLQQAHMGGRQMGAGQQPAVDPRVLQMLMQQQQAPITDVNGANG